MTSTTTSTELNVSLEPHLLEFLKNLQGVLPENIASETASCVAEPPKLIIPYRLLYDISHWSQTVDGASKLRSKSISPQACSMVALLAGSTTSPERKFGDYVREKEPEEVAYNQLKERKAITTLANAVFSIFGAGFAAWWAADKTGWKDEWKVLFALFVGILVASSEAILYLIWSSRKLARPRSRPSSSSDKKDDGDSIKAELSEESQVIMASSKEDEASALRQRR